MKRNVGKQRIENPITGKNVTTKQVKTTTATKTTTKYKAHRLIKTLPYRS